MPSGYSASIVTNASFMKHVSTIYRILVAELWVVSQYQVPPHQMRNAPRAARSHCRSFQTLTGRNGMY